MKYNLSSLEWNREEEHGRTFFWEGIDTQKKLIDVRGRQGRSSTKRSRILARDRYRCQYCGVKGGPFELTVDHIVPRSRGGRTAAENLCAACFACNQRKGDRTPEEARMPLLANPAALTYGMERAVLCHWAESRPEWRKYLFMEDAELVVA